MGVPSIAARHVMRRRRRPRGGQAYNPLTAFSWKAAFYAGDPLWTPPADGGAVSSWRDGGSEGKNAVQATGTKQPAYRASVAALNNRPAIQGDGVDDFLQTAAWSSALTQPYSVVVVCDLPDVEEYPVDGIGTPRCFVWRSTAGKWSMFAGATLASAAASDTDPHLWAAYANSTSSAIDIDGTEVAAGDAGTRSLTGLTIASDQTGAASRCTSGHIAFVGVIAGDITADANWPAFVAWVESEYGIAVA